MMMCAKIVAYAQTVEPYVLIVETIVPTVQIHFVTLAALAQTVQIYV